MQVLGSVLLNLSLWSSVLLYAPLALLTSPLPYRVRYRFIVQWAHFHTWLARVLCGLQFRVQGLEQLPAGPIIILAKHSSTWETLALPQLFPPYTYVLKRELMWIPLFGWALALLKPIAINRNAGRRALDQVVEQGRARLANGISVLVFPEGTRVPPGENHRWGLGGAALAAATGYPVVPVAHNAGHFWRRRQFLKRAGTIEVVIGPAIETRGRSAEEVQRLAQEWMAREMQRLDAVALRGNAGNV
jgi:1-acyl-sn-glycerol-3-phosphate acyltransferase